MITELTVEKLKGERADLYNTIFSAGEVEGKKSGEKFERERVVAIFKKSKAFKDMGELALEAIENGASLETATIKFQDKQLAGLQSASPKGVGPDLEPEPPKKAVTHLERAKAYREENKCSMTDALKATAEKR